MGKIEIKIKVENGMVSVDRKVNANSISELSTLATELELQKLETLLIIQKLKGDANGQLA